MATVEILQTEIVRALEAMAWTFNPYLDDLYHIHDYPWIVELIDSYNWTPRSKACEESESVKDFSCISFASAHRISITSLLPEEMQLQYPLVSID